MKQIFDFLFSAVLLLALSPLFFLIAIAIKVSMPGPVFFRQERVGKGGQLFLIFKFRTMIVGADKNGSKVTSRGDPRITRLGAFLRRVKFDELPQFFNVLRGEMTVVGPRPEVPEYFSQYLPKFQEILVSVKPGLTDPVSLSYYDEEVILAQYDDPQKAYIDHVIPEKCARYLSYAEKQSFLTDTKIVFATALQMIRALLRMEPRKS